MPPKSAASKEPIYKCTSSSCGKRIKTTHDAYLHPLIQVLVCRKCYTDYGTGQFELFEDGVDDLGDDNFCRWCVDGGNLFGCTAGNTSDDRLDAERCHYSFCRECITKNCPRDPILASGDDGDEESAFKWLCYACDPSRIRTLQIHAAAAIKDLNSRDNARKAQASGNNNNTSTNNGSTTSRAASTPTTTATKPATSTTTPTKSATSTATTKPKLASPTTTTATGSTSSAITATPKVPTPTTTTATGSTSSTTTAARSTSSNITATPKVATPTTTTATGSTSSTTTATRSTSSTITTTPKVATPATTTPKVAIPTTATKSTTPTITTTPKVATPATTKPTTPTTTTTTTTPKVAIPITATTKSATLFTSNKTTGSPIGPMRPTIAVAVRKAELNRKLNAYRKTKDSCLEELSIKFDTVSEMLRFKEKNSKLINMEIDDMRKSVEDVQIMLDNLKKFKQVTSV